MTPPAKIFGIGLSRTATLSLAHALRRLGYRCAHYAEHRAAERGMKTWALGNFEPDELADFDAAIDLPIAPYFARLDLRYPGSKFILTVRDLNAWLPSARDHWRLHAAILDDPDRYRVWVRLATYGMVGFDAERFRWVFETHTRNVQSWFQSRPESLLTLDICRGAGWEKLCPFLGQPIPPEPFPRENVMPEASKS